MQDKFQERSAGRLFAGTRCEVMRGWYNTVEVGLQNGICYSITDLTHSENQKRFLKPFLYMLTHILNITLRDGHLKMFENGQTLHLLYSQPSGCPECMS